METLIILVAWSIGSAIGSQIGEGAAPRPQKPPGRYLGSLGLNEYMQLTDAGIDPRDYFKGRTQ